MDRRLKTALFLSSALLSWSEGIQTTLASDKQLSAISPADLDPAARTSQQGFFDYLDKLKPKHPGKEETIEKVKKEYNRLTGPHVTRIKKALELLQRAEGSEEQQKEIKETKEKLQEKEKEVEKEKEKVDFQQKAFSATTGMTHQQVLDFLEKMEKSLRNNVGDALFYLKFSGDKNPDFAKTLGLIAKQATASEKILKEFTADKAIERLDQFLHVPSTLIDLRPIKNDFDTKRGNLATAIDRAKQELIPLVKKVRDGFDHITSHRDFSSLSPTEQEKFTKYRFEKQTGQTTATPTETAGYIALFDSAHELETYADSLVIALNSSHPNPSDYLKAIDQLKGDVQVSYEKLVGKPSGDPRQEQEGAYLSVKNGLSLYKYLKLQHDNLSLILSIKNQITTLLNDIENMRIKADHLVMLISTQPPAFTPAIENTSSPYRNPSHSNHQAVPITLLTVTEAGEKYRQTEGENVLSKNIASYLKGNKIDYHKVENFVTSRETKETSTLSAIKNLLDRWNALRKKREKLFSSESILLQIVKSDLYSEPNKTPDFISEALKALTKPLSENQKSLNTYNVLLEINSTIKNKIEDKNKQETQKAQQERRKEVLLGFDPQKITETTAAEYMEKLLTHASFDDAWAAEMNNATSKLTQAIHLLKPASQQHLKNVFKDVFEFLKANTEEQIELYELFQRVVTAHKSHKKFMEEMGKVKAAFNHLYDPAHTYDLSQQPIEAKVSQLKNILSEKPGSYLSKSSEQRAVNFAYNFPMFADVDLQPIEKKADIWGHANQTNQIDPFNSAMREALKAYKQARDHIKSIRPISNLISPYIFEGFEEDLIPTSTTSHTTATTSSSSMPTHSSASAGAPPPPPPPPGGPGAPPPPPPPGSTSSASTTSTTSGLSAEAQAFNARRAAFRAQKASVGLTGACNTCVQNITHFVTSSIIPHLTITGTGKTATVATNIENKKKLAVIKHIKDGLLDQLKNIDSDEITEAQAIAIVTASCAKETDASKAATEAATYQGQIGTLQLGSAAPTPSSSSSLSSSSSTIGHHTLRHGASSLSSSSSSSPAPFGQHALRSRAQATLSATDSAEEEIFKLQAAGSTVQDKINLDTQRIAKIKQFLTQSKGATFVGQLSDEELLAFPLSLFEELADNTTKMTKFKAKAFTSNYLRTIKGLRFHNLTHEFVKNLKADTVINTLKGALLTNELGIGGTSNTYLKLSNDGDLTD